MMKNKQLYCLQCGCKMAAKIPKNDDKKRQICLFCGWIYYNNPRPTVTAIIEKENKVLLIKRSRNPFCGDWDLVGGFVEAGETLDQALKREVKEEVGLKIIDYQYYFNWPDIYKNAADGFVGHNLGIHFLAKVEDKKPKAGDDAGKAKWFDWHNLPSNIANFLDVVRVIEKRKKDLKMT